MYHIKTFNKISSVGLDRFDPELYAVSGSEEQEDGILVRSANLHDYDFPAQLLAISRAADETSQRDLLGRIATLRQFREQLMERAAGVATRHREVLLKRLAEAGLPLPLDDERIIKEIALFADRCDVSEEMTRLESHLNQFEKICDKAEPVGRTLDFLCQEIFRELNTTGSKANDAELAQLVVTAKTELEKIREQVQNIE